MRPTDEVLICRMTGGRPHAVLHPSAKDAVCRAMACLSFLALAIAAIPATAAPIDLWFETANKFYDQKQYDSAAAYYEKITETGLSSSDVYYNLGNSYYRLNKIGPAVLYFEKALKLKPTDPDILNNLKFANLNIVDKIPDAGRGFFESILWRLHTALSLQAQLWALLALLFALSLCIAAALFASHNARLWMIYLSALLLFVSAILGTSLGIKIYGEERSFSAIVLVPSVDARNEPEGPKVLFTAHEGTKFHILKTMNRWAFVSLPNGYGGWVETSSFGRI